MHMKRNKACLIYYHTSLKLHVTITKRQDLGRWVLRVFLIQHIFFVNLLFVNKLIFTMIFEKKKSGLFCVLGVGEKKNCRSFYLHFFQKQTNSMKNKIWNIFVCSKFNFHKFWTKISTWKKKHFLRCKKQTNKKKMDQPKLTRIAIVDGEKCKPKKCNLECKKNCPVVRVGKLCIEVTSNSRLATLSESLCIGCGICVKK